MLRFRLGMLAARLGYQQPCVIFTHYPGAYTPPRQHWQVFGLGPSMRGGWTVDHAWGILGYQDTPLRMPPSGMTRVASFVGPPPRLTSSS